MSEIDTTAVIHEISYQPKNRVGIFSSLTIAQKLKVLGGLSKKVKVKLLAQLSDDHLVELLQALDPDDGVALLRLVDAERQSLLLGLVHDSIQSVLRQLLPYDAESAAGVMNLSYIQVAPESKVSGVVQRLKDHDKKTGKAPVILVTEGEKLLGFVPLSAIVVAEPGDSISELIKPLPHITAEAKRKEVLRVLQENPHHNIAVLSKEGLVLGVIFSDDFSAILNHQKASSLYAFAGVTSDETLYDSWWSKSSRRRVWLLINLATSFFAVSTITFFESIISAQVVLAVYMPVVAGMGGNAGTQTLAVLVRGLARGPLSLENILETLRQELLAAFFNGIPVGGAAFLFVLLTNGSWKIAAALAVALCVNLLVSAFFGTLVPVMMQKMGKDPASSATVFITTATDVLGFAAFLGLASFLL